jgi:hypothetical protein
MINRQPSFSTEMEERNLLSWKSPEEHTSQSQAITGTPWEVPVPRKVIFIYFIPINCKIIFY